MEKVPENQIVKRILFENPWSEKGEIDPEYTQMTERAYITSFEKLARVSDVNRALILMGPRRVGKTVLLYHLIGRLLTSRIVRPKKILYFSIDTPIYNGISLERLFELGRKASEDLEPEGYFVIFDEIQYLKDWDVHLKSMVDSYRKTKFIASGSAAAALTRKSNESGAGRFSDFYLPPVTFCEYLAFKKENDLIQLLDESQNLEEEQVLELNKLFINYINIGGFPEAIFSKSVQQNPDRFIRNDIIDKVLLRDLPGLYGIRDIQELNSLFTTLAFNTGNELSLSSISQDSGVDKEKIKKYIEYLEASFLIRKISRISDEGKFFKKQNFFKIYLTNPCIRSALFTPINGEDEFMGNMVETAIFAQWFHYPINLFYGRWSAGRSKGEVDLVIPNNLHKPVIIIEIKWSDRFANGEKKFRSLIHFCKKNKIDNAFASSRSVYSTLKSKNLAVTSIPSSVLCYYTGKNILERKEGGLLNPFPNN